MAKRVTLSISSSTCRPCSAKCSATVMAAYAASRRSRAGLSEAAQTTTARASPPRPQGGGVAGGGEADEGPRQPRQPEVVLQDLAQLPPPLPDQAQHRDIAGGAGGEHGEQRRLADTRGGEEAEPLPTPAGGEGI